MLKQLLTLQIFVLNLIQNVFTNPVNYSNNNVIKQSNNIKNTQQYNNKQVHNYDKATGAYVLSNPNQTSSDRVAIQNNTVVQKESIYEVDPTTGRYRLTKKAKQQILNKYNARTGTQELNNQLKLIIDSIIQCNNINDLNTIIINWNNTITSSITQNKLSKQYVKGIWEAWYNQNSKSLTNKLLQLCNNNIDMYKQVSRTNIFNLDTAMKFIDAI